MPSVPVAVANAAAMACVDGNFTERGAPAALERFYGRLLAVGRAPAQVRCEDYTAVTTSRTGLMTLMRALERFDPSVPLAPARPLRKDWDRWLNGRYGKAAKSPRRALRIALLPCDWPEAWRIAEGLLDQRVRVEGVRYRPLAPKTRASMVQAVGMLAAARLWAAGQGVHLPETMSGDLAEGFLRFLLRPAEPDGTARSVMTMRSAADYFQRVILFARRARLFAPGAEAVFKDIHTALVSESSDDTPMKHAKVRRFLTEHGLADLLQAALRCVREASKLPGHSAAAARLRRKAVVLALLLNGADRQGDLSAFRIGEEVGRDPDGLWHARFRQSKTQRSKDLGPYWPITSRIIDLHLLADRPAFCLPDRMAELQGRNLLALEEAPFGTYHASTLLREEFGISGHLVRTLVTDLLRVHRPDAAWAAREMLGHSSDWMQATYRTDFREMAALDKYHAALEALAGRE
jgi:hypothetical protein